jgi:hypothetical protein
MPKIQENSVFNFSSPVSYNVLRLKDVGAFEAQTLF